MFFATKAKVNDALVQLMARSVRIENRVSILKAEISNNGSGVFGPVPEIDQFETEIADGTKALALLTAAVQFEQVTPRSAAARLDMLDANLTQYERAITVTERSYHTARPV